MQITHLEINVCFPLEPTEQVMSSISPIKDERDIDKQSRFSQCCSSSKGKPETSSMNTPMHELNISTTNLYTSDNTVSEMNVTMKPSYDAEPSTPQVIPSASDTVQISFSSNFTDNHIKPEKVKYNSCKNQSSDQETNGDDKPSTPNTSPNQNSYLSDTCELPADRFSPKIIKIEDDYPNQCENQSTNQSISVNTISTLDLSTSNSSISPSTNDNVSAISTNATPRTHTPTLAVYNPSASFSPNVIKIEDEYEESVQCEQQSLKQTTKKHNEKTVGISGFPTPYPRFLNNSQQMLAKYPQTICKTEPKDCPSNNEKPSITPPYPLHNDLCPKPPDLINFSIHPPTSRQFAHNMCKDDEQITSSFQQRRSIDVDHTRIIPDNNRHPTITPENSRSPLDKPPLLIRNGMAVPRNFTHNMSRYGENLNRLSHQNNAMSNISNSDKGRYQMVNNIEGHHKCGICGKQFTDFNALYEHRLSHGNDHIITPITKIKEEKNIDYRSNKDTSTFLKDSPSKQNPYFSVSHHIPTNYVHNISRNDEVYLAMNQSKQYNPQMQSTNNFRFQANCNVQANHQIYSSHDQYMNSNGHDPSIIPQHHSTNKNKEAFYPNHHKLTNNAKSYIPEQLHGVPNNFSHMGGKLDNAFKPTQRDMPSNNRDAYISVNGHVSPHPYSHGKMANHRLQMAINSDEDRCRPTDLSVNVQLFSGPKPYLTMNDHLINVPQGICKSADCNPCVTHDKHPLQPHPQMMPDHVAVRPHHVDRFHASPNLYIISNRHPHPNNFPQPQTAPNICKVAENSIISLNLKQQANQQRMQIIQNSAQMRYQNVGTFQFYSTHGQPYLPSNSRQNMIPAFNKITENVSPNHNEIQPNQQKNGSAENCQISPPNYPKCDICGNQFPDYITLREHRTSHVNGKVMLPRVQIKEEPDTECMPLPSNNFRTDVPAEYAYHGENPYIQGNVHRHPINPSKPPSEFPSNTAKSEGQVTNQNPHIPLSIHGVRKNGVYNISPNENLPRVHPEKQQANQFISNLEVSRNPNASMADPRLMPSIQNPYLLSNGHLVANDSYPASNSNNEESSSNNIIPKPQEHFIQTSSQTSNSNTFVEKSHKCDTCGETYTDYSKLKEHRKKHASEKQFSCELCDKTFTQNSTLKRHQRTHTREKPYKCEICGKSFSHNYNLKEHGKTHTGEKPYKCDVCDKTFAQNYHLKEHQTTHSDAKPFKCEKCSKQFSLDSYLKKHQKIHTGEKPYKCDVCDKQFLQNSHLKDHRRIHTGEKPFKCEICGIRFSQNYTLKIHQRTHTGEKPYKCEICLKRFSQNSHLKEHRTRTHSGDKPFKCDQCHKEFSLDSYLKKHQKIHSGEKPFKCDICEKQFSQNYHLKEHRRIHTGEKPYKCQICEMRFSQNCSLKIHQRIHTGEKPYECEICGKQFSHSSNVKTHKRVHLNEKAKANSNQAVVSVSNPLSTDSQVNVLPPVPVIALPVIASS